VAIFVFFEQPDLLCDAFRGATTGRMKKMKRQNSKIQVKKERKERKRLDRTARPPISLFKTTFAYKLFMKTKTLETSCERYAFS
tara:strand:+ start:2554 stop:2805 length:252 start_codon:yes stop_codon:yes gene_type:complete